MMAWEVEILPTSTAISTLISQEEDTLVDSNSQLRLFLTPFFDS